MSDADPTKHDMSVDRKQEHITKKVYLFPDSYNALRKELMEHWPRLWKSAIQYYMWANGPEFVSTMDQILDTVTQFDSDNVDGICKKFLDELRVKRGYSRLHNPSEYHDNVQMEANIRRVRAEHEEAPWKHKQ